MGMTEDDLRRAISGPMANQPMTVPPGFVGPLQPGVTREAMGPPVPQPQAPPQAAPAPPAKGSKQKVPTVTEDDIRAGKVPGWGLGPNGYPVVTDPAQAKGIKYKWAGGVDDLSGPGGSAAGESMDTAQKGYAESLDPNKAIGPGWPGLNIPGLTDKKGKDKPAPPAAPAAPPPSPYMTPEMMQGLVTQAVNPMFEQLNWIADQFAKQPQGKAQAETLRGAAADWHKAIPARSALAYVQNLPTVPKSQATGDLSLGPSLAQESTTKPSQP